MMIYNNGLFLFLLERDPNRVFYCNLYLVQELIHLDDPDGSKFKRICADFPNIEMLAKSSTPEEVQAMYELLKAVYHETFLQIG